MQKFQLKIRENKKLFDKIISWIIVATFAALLLLIWYRVVPVATVDIKVPVATDKSSYYPGQEISGIFFGKVFYEGKVDVLREVYCKNYQGIIKTEQGGDIYHGISKPTELKGDARKVGNLPANIPVGSNCVIQFVNTYHVWTPFGDREINVTYYTQNFAIITKERRQQLDCEATGSKDCRYLETSSNQVTTPDDGVSSNAGSDPPLYSPGERLKQANEPAKTQETPQAQSGVSDVMGEKAQEPVQGNGDESGQDVFEPVTPPKQCSIRLLDLLCVKL